MTRSAAAKAREAAEALLVWLRTQPGAVVAEAGIGAEAGGRPAEAPGSGLSEAPAAAATAQCLDRDTGEAVAPASAVRRRAVRHRLAAPLCLSHTDWLHHRLTITGPADQLAAWRAAAAGAGTIPWQLDLDRMEEDWFHLLVAPPAPQPRTLSVAGARVLAGQLREAVARRHALAVPRVGRSGACPFDLHALVPVPEAVLRRGPDDPASIAWLWHHWGTTQALRHVADITPGGHRPGGELATFTFWSADWTPWRALARLAERWPALCFEARPTYGTL